jgi:hypothetical protein
MISDQITGFFLMGSTNQPTNGLRQLIDRPLDVFQYSTCTVGRTVLYYYGTVLFESCTCCLVVFNFPVHMSGIALFSGSTIYRPTVTSLVFLLESKYYLCYAESAMSSFPAAFAAPFTTPLGPIFATLKPAFTPSFAALPAAFAVAPASAP